MSKSFLEFLIRNFSAQGFSQVVTILIQFLSIPLLIKYWGVEQYGIWLLISTVPVYLSFSDFGFTFVAKNKMSILVSANKRHDALVVYQSVFLLLSGVGLFLLSTYFLFWLLGGFDYFFYNYRSYVIPVAFLLASAVLYQFMLLLFGAIRSEGRSDLETYFVSGSRLFDFLTLCLGVFGGFGILGASITLCMSKLFYLLLIKLWVQRRVSWAKLGYAFSDRDVIREMFSPSVQYMLIPLSNSFLIQGPLLILGQCYSPSAVAAFSVMRTVSRVGASVGNVLNYVFVPAYSYIYGSGDRIQFVNKFKLHAQLAALILAAYLLGSYILGEWFFGYLSKGELNFNWAVYMVLVGAVFFEVLWGCLSAPGSAINRNGWLPHAIFGSSILFAFCTFLYCFNPFFMSLAVLFVTLICFVFSIFSIFNVLKYINNTN